MMSADYLQALGSAIREVRRKRRYSIAEVHYQTRICHKSIAHIERGAVATRLDNILKICQVLEVKPGTLFAMADSRL